MFRIRAPGRGVAGTNCPALLGFSSSNPPQSSWNSMVKELSISDQQGRRGNLMPRQRDCSAHVVIHVPPIGMGRHSCHYVFLYFVSWHRRIV